MKISLILCGWKIGTVAGDKSFPQTEVPLTLPPVCIKLWFLTKRDATASGLLPSAQHPQFLIRPLILCAVLRRLTLSRSTEDTHPSAKGICNGSFTVERLGGSFLSVDILHEDGTVTNSAITLSSGGFANVGGNEDLAIAFNDEVQITYVSNNPANDQYFSLILFNCVSNCNGNPDACTQIDDLSSGVIYSAPASLPNGTHLGNVGRSFWTGKQQLQRY